MCVLQFLGSFPTRRSSDLRRALSGYGSLRVSLFIVIRLFSSGGNVLLIFTVKKRFIKNKLLELLFWNLTKHPTCPRPGNLPHGSGWRRKQGCTDVISGIVLQ